MSNWFGCERSNSLESRPRSRRKWIGPALALLVTAGCQDSHVSNHALEALAPTVLRIQAFWVDRDGIRRQSTLGTGFLVSDEGHVVTARHVVEHGRELGKTHGSVQIITRLPFAATPGGQEPATARVTISTVAEDPDNDLALLQLGALAFFADDPESDRASGPDRLRVAQLSMQAPRIDDLVVLSGYPTPHRERINSVGRIIEMPNAETRESPAEHAPSPLERIRADSIFFADLKTRIGHSGSPVFLLEAGDVIGLCIAVLFRSLDDQEAGLPDGSEIARRRVTAVIRSRKIIEFLDENRVPWKTVAVPPSTDA